MIDYFIFIYISALTIVYIIPSISVILGSYYYESEELREFALIPLVNIVAFLFMIIMLITELFEILGDKIDSFKKD
jgi:hypothetical protein